MSVFKRYILKVIKTELKRKRRSINMKEDEFQKVKAFANTVLQECENKGLTNKEVEYFKEYLPKLIQIKLEENYLNAYFKIY
jgi:hypothetical protein